MWMFTRVFAATATMGAVSQVLAKGGAVFVALDGVSWPGSVADRAAFAGSGPDRAGSRSVECCSGDLELVGVDRDRRTLWCSADADAFWKRPSRAGAVPHSCLWSSLSSSPS